MKDRDFATMFRKQEKATNFKLSEKSVTDNHISNHLSNHLSAKEVILEVEEVEESQKSDEIILSGDEETKNASQNEPK